jgi:outer membrane protein TolC
VTRVPLFAIVLVFFGCAVGPNYKRPRSRRRLSGARRERELDRWRTAWWKLFRDPVLQELIRTALGENKDLRLAIARVAEARAQPGLARAAQFPQVDAQGSYTNERFSQNSFPVCVRCQGRPQSTRARISNALESACRSSWTSGNDYAARRKPRVWSWWRLPRTSGRSSPR